MARRITKRLTPDWDVVETAGESKTAEQIAAELEERAAKLMQVAALLRGGKT